MGWISTSRAVTINKSKPTKPKPTYAAGNTAHAAHGAEDISTLWEKSSHRTNLSLLAIAHFGMGGTDQ